MQAPSMSADELRDAITAILADQTIRALGDLRLKVAETLWGDAPQDWDGFIAFAERAGVSRSARYEAAGRWGRQRCEDGVWLARNNGHTALYRLFAAGDGLLYIGITDQLRARMKQHAAEQPWWPEVVRRTVAWYDDWESADKAETLAIAAEKPVHNKAKLYSPVAAAEF